MRATPERRPEREDSSPVGEQDGIWLVIPHKSDGRMRTACQPSPDQAAARWVRCGPDSGRRRKSDVRPELHTWKCRRTKYFFLTVLLQTEVGDNI